MTLEELEEALLALSMDDHEALVERTTGEHRRRMYAAFEAARRPGEIAFHEAHLARHLPAVPWCREFDDVLDGYVVHASDCPNWPKSWLSGPSCISLRKG